MVCHVKNKKVELLLEETDTAFGIIMNQGVRRDMAANPAYNFMRSFRQLLQKPDLSKAQLSSWLRTAERRKTPRKREDVRRLGAFMQEYVLSNANSNKA